MEGLTKIKIPSYKEVISQGTLSVIEGMMCLFQYTEFSHYWQIFCTTLPREMKI